QAHLFGWPSEFKRPPLGQSVYDNYQVQVANGDAARMVLYDYDFVGCGAHLNLKGKDRLGQIAAMLPSNFFPIVIERTPANPALAEARRLEVLSLLAQGPFPIPPERLGIPPPPPNRPPP